MNGEQHLAFAADARNYEVLDHLISQGTSLDDFLSKYAKVTVQTAAPDIKPAVVSVVLYHSEGFALVIFSVISLEMFTVYSFF